MTTSVATQIRAPRVVVRPRQAPKTGTMILEPTPKKKKKKKRRNSQKAPQSYA